MHFEHDSLLASARLSGRTLSEEWSAEVQQGRADAYAGNYIQSRTRATRQFAAKHAQPEFSVGGTHQGAAQDAWAPNAATRYQSTNTVSYANDPKQRADTTQRQPLERRPGMRDGEQPSGDLKPGPTQYPRRQYATVPTAEEELRKLSVTNERYVDGDRVTEIYPAREWLARDDANPLVQRKAAPPALPRHSSRDHLSDRNRVHSLFDPAQPQVTTVVRVTRRQTMDGCSQEQRTSALARDQQAAKMREVLKMQQAERLAAEAAEANELLELYSMGIRGVLAGTDATSQPGDKAKARSPIVTRARAADRAEGVAAVAASPAAAVAAQRDAFARATANVGARTSTAASPSVAPIHAAPGATDDLSWVTAGPVAATAPVKRPRPKEVAPLFPPGAFDIRDSSSAHKLKQAQRFAPCRASG